MDQREAKREAAAEMSEVARERAEDTAGGNTVDDGTAEDRKRRARAYHELADELWRRATGVRLPPRSYFDPDQLALIEE